MTDDLKTILAHLEHDYLPPAVNESRRRLEAMTPQEELTEQVIAELRLSGGVPKDYGEQ
jgi:hypothetical protein